MDKLDSILLDAWNRINKKVRHDRLSALRRSQRRFKGVLTRPMREWCLVIRASDTRMRRWADSLEPMTPSAIQDYDPSAAHEEHTLTITGAGIRELTKPITIPWPGVSYHQAARIMGREYKTFKVWVRKVEKKGMVQIDEYRAHRFPELTYHGGHGGKPHVWTPLPLDPNNFEGRAPHRVWGSLWQYLWMDLPEHYELVVKREPKYIVRKGIRCFRGWDFICPGRFDEHGKRKKCGRRCTYLYGPQKVWTLTKAIAGESGVGFAMPEDSGLVGEWTPGLLDPVAAAAAGGLSFACKTCWGVRSACMANRNGWNEFITQISGGLLYGREVPRPADICPIERKKAVYRWKKRRKGASTPGEVRLDHRQFCNQQIA